MSNNFKTCGIIGGMGPSATADLFQKIIKMTAADTDQQHVPLIIHNNPQIPDRTAAILRGEQSPIDQLVSSAKMLENAGADFLALPCNTAHYFIEEIQKHVNIPILNMIALTSEEILGLKIKKPTVLATSGTIKTKLYENALKKKGLGCNLPSEEQQKMVDDLIYSVKAGKKDYDITPFKDLLNELSEGDDSLFILGCTELPVAFEWFDIQNRYIDPTMVLAKNIVLNSGAKLA
jgi:aspartate racemase